MRCLTVRPPVSAGILLSYSCSSECRHCMYGCSPRWSRDWMAEEDLAKVVNQLSGSIVASPGGPDAISLSHGLHLTGGEPFLNPHLLERAVEIAESAGIPSVFVETNCSWCTEDRTVRERLSTLRTKGLKGIVISVNPFLLETVPFERTLRAVSISRDLFGNDAVVYQQHFYVQFRTLGIKGRLSFEEYLDLAGPAGLASAELLPMGRLTTRLSSLFRHLPAQRLFDEECTPELTREWHVHIDNYANYIPGFCAGISLGDARSMESIFRGVDLDEYPVLSGLASRMEELFDLARGYGYEESAQGYISKCHLCLELRKYLAGQSEDFPELRPGEFYSHI